MGTPGLFNPLGGNQGNQQDGGMDFSSMFDPTSWMGAFGDPLSAAQTAMTGPSANQSIDPNTGAAAPPGGGQQSGATQPLDQLRNLFMGSGANPLQGGVGNIQRTPPAPGQPTAPAWYTPNQMFPNSTLQGDPSRFFGGYAGSGWGPQAQAPASVRQAAPAQVPLPQPRPAAADAGNFGMGQIPTADPSTSADVSLQGAGPAAPAPSNFVYDPSQDPFGTGQTVGSSGGLPIPTQRPTTFSDILLPGPGSPAQAPTPPADTAQAAPIPPVGNTPNIWQSGTSPVPQQSITGSGAPQPVNLPPQAAAASPPTDATGTPAAAQPAPGEAPATQPPAGAQPGAGRGQQGQQFPQFNPLQAIMDLLLGGPQALFQDLGSLAGQAVGGYGGYAPQGGQPGAAAPWLAQGGRAPRGTNPMNYPMATPQQLADIRAGRAPREVPSATEKPQSSEISGRKQAQTPPQGAGIGQALGGTAIPGEGSPTAPGAAVAGGGPGAQRAAEATAAANAPSGAGTPIGTAGALPPQAVSRSVMAGSDTRPTAGYSNYLRQQRAPFAQEMQNPQMRLRAAAMMATEDDADPIGPMESLANRAALAKTSIGQMLTPQFYMPMRDARYHHALARLSNNPNGAEMRRYNQAIDQVLSGSNVLGGATDQGSPGDPNSAWRGGRITRGSEIYNDWGGFNRGGQSAAAAFRKEQQAAVQRELQNAGTQVAAQ